MDIGNHCNLCRQIDFLPHTCSMCNKTFCSDHLAYSAHLCAEASKKYHSSKNKDNKNKKQAWGTYTCVLCNKEELEENLCKLCNKNTCLTHRHPIDHRCVANTKYSTKYSTRYSNKIHAQPPSGTVAVKNHKRCIIS